MSPLEAEVLRLAKEWALCRARVVLSGGTEMILAKYDREELAKAGDRLQAAVELLRRSAG